MDGVAWHVRPVGRTSWAVWAAGHQLPMAVFASLEQAMTWVRRLAEPIRHGRVLVHDVDESVAEEVALGDEPHLPD